MRLRRTLLLACLGALACAPAAGAGTASTRYLYTTGDSKVFSEVWSMSYSAAPGETNRLTVRGDRFSIRIADAGAPITPGPGCRADGAEVVCRADTNVSSELTLGTLELGDGDDTLELVRLGANVIAGPGNDEVSGNGSIDSGPGADVMRGRWFGDYSDRTAPVRVTGDGVANDGEAGEGDNFIGEVSGGAGGSGDDELRASAPNAGMRGNGGNDVLVGTAGRDTMDGGPGDDSLDGLDGDDALRGDEGADVLRGSGGVDTLTYTTGAPVTVVLDETGGDGAVGEGDDVRGDVENVSTGDGDDVLIGSAAANSLIGGRGADRIEGGAGDDHLGGRAGANRLVGGSGADVIDAAEYGPGRHVDRIEARDGERDRIVCGASGADDLVADPDDRALGCAPVAERAWRGAVRASRSGAVRLRVRCPVTAAVSCAGRLSLYDDIFELRAGVGEFRGIGPGRTGVVTVRLKSAFRRTLVAEERLSMAVFVIARRSRPDSTAEGFHALRLLRPR